MPDLSICIVSLNARQYLKDCLDSLQRAPLPSQDDQEGNEGGQGFEIIVVDNGSCDGTYAMLQQEYPHVHLLRNETNEGFVRPINRAMQTAVGHYVMLLNPDTIVLPCALSELVAFMEEHPQVGICGPKVLNRDGTLQKACRRGISRPWAAFSYFLGLSALFPRSKLFGGYLLNYMDEDATHEVDGVSGSCMLIRRAVIEQVGYFDERYFAYQEDADYCFQAQKAGWVIYYIPQARIIHYGGQGGSRVQPYRSIYEWHRSYYLYYRKNLADDYFFLFNWFYYLLMGLKLLLALFVSFLRKEKYAGPRRG